MSARDEIIIDNFHYSYPPLTKGGPPTPVLRGINLRVARGQFVALLGRVGAGKTTLCMALNGLVPQVTGGVLRGDITVAGLNTKRQPVARLARAVGLVFQDPETQLVQMRVEDEIAFGLENLGIPAPEMEERLSWALAAVGLTAYRLRSPLDLSGGEKQRVAIAAMLAMRPRVLVLDEPTASLDPAGKAAVMAVLTALRASYDVTIVMATQELELIGRHADRILVLDDGRIAMDGQPGEVFAQAPRLYAIGIGVPQMPDLAHRLLERTGHRYHLDTVGRAYMELRASPRLRYFQRTGAAGTQPPTLPANPEAEQPQVSVEGVSFSYEDGTQALRGVDLVLRPGEWLALLGPNGAGKSTLARHFDGLLRPARGRVLVEGADTRQVQVARLARSVGYVFQNPDHQIFAPTVREELAFGLRNLGLPPAAIETRIAETLAQFDLGSVADMPPALLGFAQRRKVALAAVLAMQPRLLILDEPTGGLDWRSQSELMQVVTSYREQGCSVVLITHDMRLVAEHTKRAVVLLEGRVLYDGSARELFARPDVLQVAGLTSPPVTRLAARLRRAGMDPILSNDEFVARWLARPISQRARGRVGEAARRRWALRNAKGRAQ